MQTARVRQLPLPHLPPATAVGEKQWHQEEAWPAAWTNSVLGYLVYSHRKAARMDQTVLQPQHKPSATPDASPTPPTAAHEAPVGWQRAARETHTDPRCLS